MKKIITIIGVIILIITTGFSGCIQENNDNGNTTKHADFSKFIGEWEEISDKQFNDIWIFYENTSIKFLYFPAGNTGNNYPYWGTFSLDDDILDVSSDNIFPVSDRFTYEFSDNYTKIILTSIYGGDTTELNKKNSDPVATDDYFTVNKNSIDNMLDIKTNDYDPDGDTISIQTVKAVSSGWVDWYENLTVEYTPETDFTGIATFEYYINDGRGGLDNATVFITIINETESKNETEEKVELVNYSIVTRNFSGDKIGEGFVYSEEAFAYEVTGQIKNIANETLNTTTITVIFYDINNNLINAEVTSIIDLTISETRSFSVEYTELESNFENADHVTFLFKYGGSPIIIT